MCNNEITETVELVKQSIYDDVSQIEHNMMRMKTTNYMRTENTLPANSVAKTMHKHDGCLWNAFQNNTFWRHNWRFVDVYCSQVIIPE